MPTEVVIAQEDDLDPGEMKQITAEGPGGDTDVLLARTRAGPGRNRRHRPVDLLRAAGEEA